MNLLQRMQAPTPKFFRVLRTIGLSLAAAGGALIASPVALPVGIVTLAGYLIVAGSVATAVSQATVKSEPEESIKD
jgi:ABC-type xylose transport system permease subunit